jgi:hypothetical protein
MGLYGFHCVGTPKLTGLHTKHASVCSWLCAKGRAIVFNTLYTEGFYMIAQSCQFVD